MIILMVVSLLFGALGVIGAVIALIGFAKDNDLLIWRGAWALVTAALVTRIIWLVATIATW